MILEGFYRIDDIRQNHDGYAFDVTLFSGHKIYDGHFPGTPVVPGVCTLTVIIEALSKAIGKNMMFSSIKECKFLAALIPDNDLSIVISMVCGEEGSLRCTVHNGDVMAMKLNATVAERNGEI